MDLTSGIDLFDSDIVRIERVLAALNAKRGKSIPLEAFRKEVVDRFFQIGLGVDVRVWETNVAGVFAFDIQINSRSEAFDPDRMVHEVTNDLLDLGEGGVISSQKAGMRDSTPKGKASRLIVPHRFR